LGKRISFRSLEILGGIMKTKYPKIFGLLAMLMLVASFVVPTSLVSPSAVQADPGICKWDNLAEPGAGYGLFNIYANEILDWAMGSDGTNMFAIVRIPHATLGGVNMLLKSPAYTGLFWTAGSYAALGRKAGFASGPYPLRQLYQVAMAPDNPNFVVVTSDGGAASGADFGAGPKEMWVSQNGGADWEIANLQLKLAGVETIRTIDISVDYGGKRDIAVGTANAAGAGKLIVVKSTGFTGWQTQVTTTLGAVDFFAIKFSPSYASDAALAVVFATVADTFYNVALRDLDANTIVTWALPLPGVEVNGSTTLHLSPGYAGLNKADLELPSDFSGQAASLRRAYISLDTYNCGAPKATLAAGGGWDGIVRIDDTTVYNLMDTYNNPDKSIYSIAYFGTYASGKLLAGDRMGYPCDATVPTYFTDSPTTCPVPCWYTCLKCPTGAACGAGACNCPTLFATNQCAIGAKTGVGAAQVMWRPNGQLAFAATGGLATGMGASWWYCWAKGAVTPCDESAFAISRNNGETWNEVSLIDTKISKFTDIAPSADCKTIYLASVNTGCFAPPTGGCTFKQQIQCDNTTTPLPTFRDLGQLGGGYPNSANCTGCGYNAYTILSMATGGWNATTCRCDYTITGNITFDMAAQPGCWTFVPFSYSGSIPCATSTNITVTLPCYDGCGPRTTTVEGCCGFDSVWRTSSNADVVSPLANLPVGTLWERVWTHVTAANCLATQTNVALLRLVPWCADPTGEIVGWGVYGAAVAFWSPDFGDFWAPITLRNAIQDFTFESRTMLYFLSPTGLVQKMPYTGTAWSTSLPNYDSGINPAHTIAAMPTGKVLVGKGETALGAAPYAAAISLNMDTDNPVFVPQLSSGPLMGGNVHVAFDPQFDDNSIYYIDQEGVGGSVYRNNPTAQLRWPDTNMLAAANGAVGCLPLNPAMGFSGLVLAYTGHALYASSQVPGWGVFRVIDDGIGKYGPLSGLPKPGIAWDQLSGVSIGLPIDVLFTAQPSALKACGCCTLDTDTTLYVLDDRPYTAPSAAAPMSTQGKIWAFTDCLAKRGPSLVTEDKVLIGCDPVSGRAGEVNLCWEQLCVANAYDIEVAKDANFTIRVLDWMDEGCSILPFSPADVTTPCAYVPAGGIVTGSSAIGSTYFYTGNLECGHTYYFRVRARGCATGAFARSPWSEVRSFTVKAGYPVVSQYPGLQLLAPANGSLGVPVQPVSFSWSPFGDATKYKFVLAKDADMTQVVKEAETTSTAYGYDGKLDYSTNYFWRVMATEPAPSDWSATFSFQTAAEVKPISETQPVTPTPIWVWVVIAIGAILVIVTLVLIFKTRRV
jgi:hypothetical protein